jgi:hypothetical protein
MKTHLKKGWVRSIPDRHRYVLFVDIAAFLGFQGATDGTLQTLHKRLVSKGPACPAVPVDVLEFPLA